MKVSKRVLESAYDDEDGGVTVSRSFHIRREQDEMLKELAVLNGVTKVGMLRMLIDDWRLMRFEIVRV